MSRRLRFFPPNSLVEVTTRTLQGRFLLQPSAQIADLCRGVLARAARLYPVKVHAFSFLGNHYHLLLSAPDAQRLALFMNYLNSNLAREIGRTVRWRERFWGRRYQAIAVSTEETAQVERLLYILRQGCKEGLVRRPSEWPGATAVASLLSGEPVRGSWVDRTLEYTAARRGRRLDPRAAVSIESLELAPLPCWQDVPPAAYRKRVRDLVDAVELETAHLVESTGREPIGPSRVALQNPHGFPNRLKRRPAPLVHAATRRVRIEFREAYRAFVSVYRRASEQLRQGAGATLPYKLFPLGSFPPPGPYLAIV
jgi:REP element-mobilizing transposase RayT